MRRGGLCTGKNPNQIFKPIRTDRGKDLGLRDEAVGQLVVVVVRVDGEDLRPRHLVTSQLLVGPSLG